MALWLFTLLALVILFIVVKAYQKQNYFKKWGIPYPKEIPFIGILGANILTGPHFNILIKQIYNTNKEAKYIGCHMFLDPVIIVRDLELIKSVLIKNFDYFAYHKAFVEETVDPLFGKNLAMINGERWRDVRNLLSPAFTSSKMKTMFVLMSQCAENFVGQFLDLYADKKDIDIKDVFTRYANDVIATCAFGIETDSLKNPNNEFYVRGRDASNFRLLSMIKLFLIRASPSLSQLLGLRLVSKKNTDFYVNLVQTTIKAREEKGIIRPDMLQLLMDAQDKKKMMDLMEITAQAFIFFLGGFETTSTVMCLIAHELAINPEVQEQLQAEIDAVMKETDGKLTYEAINNMPYLDAVFMETMRVHPFAFIDRMCSKEFELPPALPGSKPYVLKPGTEIFIPIAAIHSDPDYYENPERFIPDRFLNTKTITGDATILGFGLGPRMCIGNRFAILETKVLFVHLLAKCSFVPCSKTCIPMVYSKKDFAPTPKGGFWLKTKLRN